MTRTNRTLSIVLATLAIATQAGWAQDAIPLAEHEIFFELNNTDGDLGIHSLIDGDGWKKLSITDPTNRQMLNVRVKGRLRQQGLTEFFFESAEPLFADLPPAIFFARFPEGEYQIGGMTLDGQMLEGDAEISHAMPAPAATMVNEFPFATQCNDELPDFNATELMDPDEVVISWAEVTMSHPDPMGGGAGIQPPIPVTIENYQVVVEVEAEDPMDPNETFDAIFSIELPPWETSATIPEEFIELGDEFKYEVLAREESFNQTAVESCFVLVEE